MRVLDGQSAISFTPAGLWEQMKGMTTGLQFLHEMDVTGDKWFDGKMYHMDLKPSNILVLHDHENKEQPAYTMKIADFGLSTYKKWPKFSESRLEDDPKHAAIGIYAPPPSNVSPGYDIFSLGTIFSEIAVFDVCGFQAVQKYRERRRNDTNNRPNFHYHPHETARGLKTSVKKEHEDLLVAVSNGRRSSGPSSADWQKRYYTPAFFAFVQDEMLHAEEKSRKSAKKVVQFIQRCLDDCARGVPSQTQSWDLWSETRNGLLKARALTISPPDKPEYRL